MKYSAIVGSYTLLDAKISEKLNKKCYIKINAKRNGKKILIKWKIILVNKCRQTKEEMVTIILICKAGICQKA